MVPSAPAEPLTRPAWAVDVLVAGVVTAIIVLGTTHIDVEAASDRPVDALAVVVGVVAGVSLLGRRHWPWLVFAVVLAAAVVYTARSYPGGPIYLAGAIALYSVAIVSSRTVAYVTAAATALALFATSVLGRGEADVTDLLFVGWPAVAVLAADAVRGRRERVAAEAERRRHEAEQHREEERRRLAEDRLRIARDLHDSVAHSMATINVQSGVAAHVLDRNPGQAGAALEAIRVASRDVLDELGAILDVLRDGEVAPRHPTPDLGRLDALVESSRLAGVDVDLRRHGSFDDVSPAVAAAAYRITQEALTNVIRHAAVDRARVELRRRPDGGVELEVSDTGRGAAAVASGGSGRGLVGIRERAAITGGTATIGPRPDGGFTVRVVWAG